MTVWRVEAVRGRPPLVDRGEWARRRIERAARLAKRRAERRARLESQRGMAAR